MRSVLEWYLQWHPPIMHDLHESVPFLYTFSGQAPQNPTLDPVVYRVQGTRKGQPVIHDNWAPVVVKSWVRVP